MSKNEKKAKELAARLMGTDRNLQPLVDLLVEMAEWKESELKGRRPQPNAGGKTTIDLIQEFMTSLNLQPGDTDDIKDSAALVITARPTNNPEERDVKVYGMGDHKTLREALAAASGSDRRVLGLFCEVVCAHMKKIFKDKIKDQMFVDRILNDLDKMP